MPVYRVFVRHMAVVLLLFLTGCGRGDALAQDGEDQQVRERLGDVPAVVDTSTAAALSGTFRAAAARALPSVVTITVTGEPTVARNQIPLPFPFGGQEQQELPPQIGMGSGFVFTEDGHIITNNHVVENATNVEVRFPDGRVYSGAEIVGRDPNTDIAVVRIEPRDGERFRPLEIGNSDRLQVGDWVLALGNPLSLGFTVTAGIVSAKGRNLNILPGETALESFIQTDAVINRGNSGGPLVDLFGRVIGVNTAIYSPTGTYSGNGFAVPSLIARRAAADLIEYGHVRRPRLGVLIQDVGEAQAELYGLDRIAGALVTEVNPGSPAEEAGLRPEDVIVALDGQAIGDGGELTTRLAQREPGERVTLGVVREGRRIDVPVELGQFETQEPEVATTDARPSSEEVLGFGVSELTPQVRAQLDLPAGQQGVVVTGVSQYGPALGTLQQGDVILELNREPVGSVRDFQRIAQEVERGDIVVIRVRSRATGNIGVRSFRVR